MTNGNGTGINVQDFFSDKHVDLHGYITAHTNHPVDDLEGKVRVAEQAAELLGQQHVQEHLSELGQETYQSIKQHTSQALGHSQEAFIPKEHYETKLHEPGVKEAFLKSFITNKLSLLSKYGQKKHIVDSQEVSSMGLDSLKQTANVVAAEVDRYHGGSGGGSGSLTSILEGTVFDESKGDLQLGDAYTQLGEYFSQATQSIPQAISQPGLMLSANHLAQQPYSARVEEMKHLAKQFSLPLKEGVQDIEYAFLNPRALFTLNSLYQQGSLTKDFAQKLGFDKVLNMDSLASASQEVPSEYVNA